MILDDLKPIEYPSLASSKDGYQYNDQYPVPRVTEILSAMLHEDGLMHWSNYLGLKRQQYKTVLKEAADKGTLVHAGIEDFISNGNQLDLVTIPSKYQNEVSNAYLSFMQWWEIITKHDYKILMQEEPLICPWYGGTLDLLMEIDGKVYLFDFKTSNHITYKYILQLAAYKFMLKLIHNIEVDCIGIIKLNKTCVEFEESLLDCNEYKYIVDSAENCFHYLVRGYYERKQVEQYFKEWYGSQFTE